MKVKFCILLSFFRNGTNFLLLLVSSSLESRLFFRLKMSLWTSRLSGSEAPPPSPLHSERRRRRSRRSSDTAEPRLHSDLESLNRSVKTVCGRWDFPSLSTFNPHTSCSDCGSIIALWSWSAPACPGPANSRTCLRTFMFLVFSCLSVMQ